MQTPYLHTFGQYIKMICLFSQDPERQITDPDICRLCDCEAEGTVDEGMCDESTSEELGTQAGQCHCKTYVGGPRCDHCAPGETIPNFAVQLYLSLVLDQSYLEKF